MVVGWAVLCLAGLLATSTLNAEPFTDTPEPRTGEPTPTGTYAIDCQEIADDVEQARAQAEREQREALDPSTASSDPRVVVEFTAVPEECADGLEDRGLKTR